MAEVVGSNSTDAEIFIYTGEGGAVVPQDVVRARVDPSVTSIPANAFHERKKLTEVELCEGVVEIGVHSFSWCDHSIKKINFPTSLRRICNASFSISLRTPIRLHDGIESIGRYSFSSCIFTNFRVPSLITAIPEYMLSNCTSMFSLELSQDTTEIGYFSFGSCYCLRNVAIPPNAVFGDAIFIDEDVEAITDLQRLFGSEERIVRELIHRFDELPVHSVVYCQSYHQGVLKRLIEQDPTGSQQDCLGMTPLHILTCSSVHDLELYRIIVENYPTNLITEDRWGALPLLYAFWGAAPAEIIQFLLESYQTLYPGHEFNWTMMLKTMGRTSTPKERIENLLHVRQIHFPEQPIDWEYLLDEFVKPSDFYMTGELFQEQIRFLFMCGLSERVENLAFKVWRDSIPNMIYNAKFDWGEDSSDILRSIRSRITHFEDELPKLKEATTVLELALWKKRIHDTSHQQKTTRDQKKIKTEGASPRQQYRVTCGADIIIGHVMPYLISTGDDIML